MGGVYTSDSWGIEVDDSLGKSWAVEASGRCEIEALGVVLVVGRASTTSRVAELDMLVRVGVGKGEMGEAWVIHQVLSSANPVQFSCAIVFAKLLCWAF